MIYLILPLNRKKVTNNSEKFLKKINDEGPESTPEEGPESKSAYEGPEMRVRPKILNFILVFSKPYLQIFWFTGTDIPSDSQKNGFYIFGEQYNFWSSRKALVFLLDNVK